MLIRTPRDLALFIADCRKSFKLNQTQTGDLVGLKQKTISSFENNPEGTKIETNFRILSAWSLRVF